MQQYKLPIKKQEKIFLDLILRNSNIDAILNRGFVSNISNWYLVSGCLNQTIWNQLTNRKIENGIKDYDLIYFDPDISIDKENKIKKLVTEKFADLKINLDVVNQARVHLWIEKDWGLKMRPLISSEDGVASWPITVSCVGVKKTDDAYIIMAPYGLTDSLEMILRPNKTTVMRESDFNYKVNKWLKKWPELSLIPW